MNNLNDSGGHEVNLSLSCVIHLGFSLLGSLSARSRELAALLTRFQMAVNSCSTWQRCFKGDVKVITAPVVAATVRTRPELGSEPH